LEDIQKENENKVRFTFFDGKANPAIKSQIVTNMINDNYELLLIGMVDKREPTMIEDFIYKAKQKNIPLIFYNITPDKLDVIKAYSKSLIINVDSV
jgi:methyl-galactoside transport system substrate-binding protein